MLAEELMLFVTRVMWDPDRGFRDRPVDAADIGLLAEPVTPFVLNCDAARVWLRLAALAEQPDYRQRAVSTLASQHGRAAEHGLFAAPFAIAVEELRAYEERCLT
jgi:uncharacterized protein YyaL (SSP411 family)